MITKIEDTSNKGININLRNVLIILFFLLVAVAVMAGTYISKTLVTYNNRAAEVKNLKSLKNINVGTSTSNFILSLNMRGGETYPTYINFGIGASFPFIGSDFTIENWLKIPRFDNNPLSNLFTYKRNSNPNNYVVKIYISKTTNGYTINSSVLTAGAGGGQDIYLNTASNQPINYGSWNHIAIAAYRIPSDNLCHLGIYINGILNAQSTVANGDHCYFNSSYLSDFYLGRDVNSIASFNGYIDELRISIGNRYPGNFIPPYPELSLDNQTTALYHFNGNLVNVAPFGRPGIAVGADYQILSEDILANPTPTPTFPPTPTLISPPPVRSCYQSCEDARCGNGLVCQLIPAQTCLPGSTSCEDEKKVCVNPSCPTNEKCSCN